MTFPVKGSRIEEAPGCGVRAEVMITNALVWRVTETTPLDLLEAWHTELLAYFDNYRLRLLLAHSASLAIRNTHGQQTRPRFVTENQFCCDNCRSINARRL